MSPIKVETSGHYLIVHFSDGVRHLDMGVYLKKWRSADAGRLLGNIDRDLKDAYLEDGYAISWKGYNLSIDPETFYEDATKGYPKDFESVAATKDSTTKLIDVLRGLVT
jgi:hypothetical protein